MTQLRCTSARGKILAPVRPSAAIQAAYYRALMALVDEMQDSIVYWLRANYRKVEPQIVQQAQDASPASVLQSIMSKLTEQWRKRFADAAGNVARGFARRATGHADRGFLSTLSTAGFTVKFRPSDNVRDAMDLAVHENVALIKSIAEHHLTEVEGLVMRSALRGGDLGELTTDLRERYGITQRRAAFIARDQNAKMTAVINRRRQQDLGITEAIWRHSHGGKHPRASHVKADRDKLRYRLDKGAYIDGEFIFPGELPNCRCVSRPIVPGFDD